MINPGLSLSRKAGIFLLTNKNDIYETREVIRPLLSLENIKLFNIPYRLPDPL